jgi:hypothetical protein
VKGPIGFLAAAVSSAVSIGLLVITATVLWVDALRTKSGPADLDLSFYLLVGGTLLGILLAAYVAWRLLSPIGSAYRRGGLSIVCSFATVLLMLICIPVNQLFGRIGLFVLLGSCGVLATVLARRARRLGSGV